MRYSVVLLSSITYMKYEKNWHLSAMAPDTMVAAVAANTNWNIGKYYFRVNIYYG